METSWSWSLNKLLPSFQTRFDKKNETEKKILLRGNLIVLFMAVFLLIYNDFPINSGSRVHEK